MARDTPAAPSPYNRATCAFAAGGLLRFEHRTSESFGALLRAGVEAPQIIIEQSIGRFSMQVAHTLLMAWILPVRGNAHFGLILDGRPRSSERARNLKSLKSFKISCAKIGCGRNS